MIKQLIFVIAMLMLLAKLTYAADGDIFIVNGKRVDAVAAYFAGTNSKNEVLRCHQENVQIDTKGNAKLKKAATGWTPLTK